MGCQLHTVETSRGTVAQSVTVKPTGCEFDPHSRRCNIYLNLYFPFFALVSKQKRGVDFYHSTRNAFRIRQKVRKGVSYHWVPSAYPAVFGIQREAK